MTTVNALPVHVLVNSYPVETHPSLCMRISQIALLIIAIIPALTMQFIHQGKAWSNKIFAITVGHTVPYFNFNDSLCFTKNIAARSVIWNGEDASLGGEWIQRLELKHPVKASGATIDGVCLGACIIAVKDVTSASIRSESELIALISKYQEGFPVEAAAFQMAYHALTFNYNQDPKATVTGPDILSHLISRVVPFIHLELDTRHDIKERGCYCIATDTHAVALFNFDFGTYVLDACYGLFPWDAARQEKYKDFTKVYSFKCL